jgi:hypothetical protein
MLTVEHAGHTFKAEGNTVFVDEEFFTLVGDIKGMQARQSDLYVDTTYASYVLAGGPEPRHMFVYVLRMAA